MPSQPSSISDNTAGATLPVTGSGSVLSEPRAACLPTQTLSATQVEIVNFCADAAQLLGLSKSVGQIFGAIYCSPEPLAFTDIVPLLGISKGSASQGMHYLRDLGAIKLVDTPGGRRDCFVTETDLRLLVASVLQRKSRGPLERGLERLQTIEQRLAAEADPNREFLQQRLDLLRTWHHKALHLLPLIQRLLGSRKR